MDEEKSRAKTKRRKEGTHERMMIGNDDGVDLYEFDVSGMSCGTCAEWVTDAIKKNVDDVVEVDVRSVKNAERNVAVSVVRREDDDDDDENKDASSKKAAGGIIRALEFAGYGCVESGGGGASTTITEEEEGGEEETERLLQRATMKDSASSSSFTEQQRQQHPTTATKTYHFNVEGMTCASCVSAVENAIKSLSDFENNIASFSVNLLSESATVVVANDSVLKPEDIANEISDFGFDTTVSKPDAIKFNVSGMVCQSCPPRIENAISKRFPSDVVSVSASELLEKVVVEMKSGTSFGARDILYAIQSLGYGCEIWNENESEGREKERKSKLIERKYKKQFLLSVPLALPLLLMMIIFDPIDETKAFFMQKVGGTEISLMWIISWILATPAQFVLGYQFYARAFSALKHKTATMDTLIAMGTSAAYFYSVYVVLKNVVGSSSSHHDAGGGGGGHEKEEDAIFFETSTVLISFVLLGKWLEARAKGKASEAIQKLVSLAPNTAIICEVIEEKNNEDSGDLQIVSEKEIQSNLLKRGDVVKIVPGSAFPVDGVVLSGETAADESAITGESLPVPKTINAFVIAGTTNTFGTVFVTATNVGAERALNKIVRLVEDAQTSKAPIQARADKISAVFVPSVVALAFLSFIFWLIAVKATNSVPKSWTDDEGEFVFCFVFFVTVLVIACPCALGLATPTAVMVGTGVGAKLGILIKGGQPLEIAHDVTVVCFDKTGTLTLGKPSVVEVFCARSSTVDEKELIRIAGAAEKSSEHPLGKAIVLYAEEDRQLDFSDLSVTNFASIPGRGLECLLRTDSSGQQKKLRVGNSDFILEGKGPSSEITSCEEKGRTVVCVELDGVFLGFIALADRPRPEAQGALRALKKRNVEIAMVSGDNKAVCETIASQIGSIDYIFSQCLPRDKVNCVKELQMRERKIVSRSSSRRKKNLNNVVAFVGDGVNDAPAMTRADIGIAVGAGTDIAMEAAGIVLVKSDIFDVVHALDLSRATFRRIEMNLFFSLGYNALGIPIAAGLLYPFVKVRLPPEVAGLAMALSSVSVVTSSLMLKRFKRCKEEEFEEEVLATDNIV